MVQPELRGDGLIDPLVPGGASRSAHRARKDADVLAPGKGSYSPSSPCWGGAKTVRGNVAAPSPCTGPPCCGAPRATRGPFFFQRKTNDRRRGCGQCREPRSGSPSGGGQVGKPNSAPEAVRRPRRTPRRQLGNARTNCPVERRERRPVARHLRLEAVAKRTLLWIVSGSGPIGRIASRHALVRVLYPR